MSLFKTYLNLAGILNRIETDLRGKASVSEVGVLTARLNAKADTKATGVTLATLEARLNTLEGIIGGKATIADLSQAKIDLGVRIDDLEKEVEALAFNSVWAELDADMSATKAEIEALDAMKTGEPNLSRIPPTNADALVSHPNFDLPVFVGDAPAVAGSVRYVDGSPKSKRQAKVVIDHLVKAPKKPRAPKGGGK